MKPIWYRRPLLGGETGHDVTVVQRKLQALATGVYDEETKQRVRGLQRSHHLAPTGFVDQRVAEILGEAADHELPPEWFTRVLEPGDSGPDVTTLRQVLGLQAGKLYDDETRRAVLRFQSAYELPLTGSITERDALFLS